MFYCFVKCPSEVRVHNLKLALTPYHKLLKTKVAIRRSLVYSDAKAERVWTEPTNSVRVPSQETHVEMTTFSESIVMLWLRQTRVLIPLRRPVWVAIFLTTSVLVNTLSLIHVGYMSENTVLQPQTCPANAMSMPSLIPSLWHIMMQCGRSHQMIPDT